MKTTIKTLFTIVAISVSASVSYAQTTDGGDGRLDRQVDVSRDYAPEVKGAQKLLVMPNMSDTVALRPDFDYTITPSAWTTGFGVAAINPVRLEASTYNPIYPFYLKAGVGFPTQSLVDLYVNTTGRGNGSAGVYVNHYGQYSKIRNDIGQKERADQNNNSFGIFGKTNVGRRMIISAEAGFDYDLWSIYGQSTYDGRDAQTDIAKHKYSTPHGRVVFGNDFSDLSYFNMQIGAGGYNIQEKNDNGESGVNVYLQMGKMFYVHQLMLKASFDGRYGSDNLDGFENSSVTIAPKYGIDTENFKLSFGFDFVYDMRQDEDKTFFLPQAKILFNVGNGSFVPYASLDSRMVDNGYRSLTKRNPYLTQAGSLTSHYYDSSIGDAPLQERIVNSQEYNIRGGFYGSVSSVFSYRLFAGLSIVKDPVFFYNYYQTVNPTGVFNTVRDKRMNVFVIGAELEGRMSGSFSAGLSAHYRDYSLKKLDHAPGLPEYDATLFVRYNYRDKLYLKAWAELTGTRYFLESSVPAIASTPVYTEQKAVVNLGLEAEYFINKKLGIFVSGDNLTGSKLYPFAHYRGLEANVNIGIKLLF